MTPTLRRFRWWDIAVAMPIEEDLFAPEQWSAGLFWSELAQGERRCYVAAADGADLLGYAGLAASRDEADIQTVAVRRDHWGRGLGSALVTALLDEADRREVQRVHLEVRASNERALRLYERFGFARSGLRRRYYEHTGDDAVLMTRRLRGAS